jgi:acyl-CoA reductase-like NAD-dependent aldehyde dehydrogenase
MYRLSESVEQHIEEPATLETLDHPVAAAVKAGTVWVNCYGTIDPAAPFGGDNMSGHGRELGSYALELYTEIKCVWVNLDG